MGSKLQILLNDKDQLWFTDGDNKPLNNGSPVSETESASFADWIKTYQDINRFHHGDKSESLLSLGQALYQWLGKDRSNKPFYGIRKN